MTNHLMRRQGSGECPGCGQISGLYLQENEPRWLCLECINADDSTAEPVIIVCHKQCACDWDKED